MAIGTGTLNCLRFVGAAVGFCLCALNAIGAGAETIRYCHNNWPPYAYNTDEGPAGISVEILKQASNRAGYTAEFNELPWERCLKSVADGEMDAVVDAAKRDGYLQGDVGFSVYTNTFWVREEFNPGSSILSALNGRRLGLVRGYVYGNRLEEQISESGAIVDLAKDDEQNIRKLSYGRTDAIIGDYVGTRIIAAQQGFKPVPVLPHHSFDLLYPSFNLGQGVMQGRINDALGSMMSDGSIDRVYRDSLGVELSDILPDASPGM